jgi:amidohydrolase
MPSRSFFREIPAFFFLSLLSCLTFMKSEPAVNEDGESAGKLDSQHNRILLERIEKTVASNRNKLIELYRGFHKHPEVSGREEKTAAIIANHLRDLGLEVKTGISGHGVVGILKGSKPGPVVAYRADMDAVFSDAPDPVSFKSETPGVRHICGHDVHVTVALGIAEALASIRENISGTIKFIFQPAEENAQGAKAMIAAGVLANPDPKAILAVHCAPLEVGQIGSAEGMMLPGLDMVRVTIEGEDDLKPYDKAIAEVISSTSTVSFESIQAEVQNDFIYVAFMSSQKNPEKNQRIFSAGVRTSSEENSAKAKKNIEAGIRKLGLSAISYKVDYTNGVMPAVMNDPALVRGAVDTIRSVRGDEGLVMVEQVPPFFGEDFAFYLQKIPGVMYWLGVSNQKKGIIGLPHHPQFAVDEEAILVGVKTMAAVLLRYLDMLR